MSDKELILSQLEELPEDWKNTFVPSLAEEIANILGERAKDFLVLQAKEKYDGLRIYWCWKNDFFTEEDDEIVEEVENIIRKYEIISKNKEY